MTDREIMDAMNSYVPAISATIAFIGTDVAGQKIGFLYYADPDRFTKFLKNRTKATLTGVGVDRFGHTWVKDDVITYSHFVSWLDADGKVKNGTEWHLVQYTIQGYAD